MTVRYHLFCRCIRPLVIDSSSSGSAELDRNLGHSVTPPAARSFVKLARSVAHTLYALCLSVCCTILPQFWARRHLEAWPTSVNQCVDKSGDDTQRLKAVYC